VAVGISVDLRWFLRVSSEARGSNRQFRSIGGPVRSYAPSVYGQSAEVANPARPALPDAIREGRIVAIGRSLDPRRFEGIAEALLAGGVLAFEITLGSPDALAGIRAIASKYGDELLVGAGTVLDIEAATHALDAGARFLVMPHTDCSLVTWAAERGVPAFPGAFTPTEILEGWRAGACAIKLFPASVAGPAFVREFRGPFPDIPLVPTGGVSAETAAAYLEAGAVAVGVGSWLMGGGDPAVVRERAGDLVKRLSAI
jgi:2-dehydro-3-deoxyphosphogluconate aldolase/(4S)-4-hydroxy-2-oxoglutarate aldolase